MSSSSSINVVEILTTNATTWVLDTGCGSHIISNVDGLRSRRQLEKGEIDLRVGNGARVVAFTVGDFSLSLPSGLVLELNNCYFVLTITKTLFQFQVYILKDLSLISRMEVYLF